MRTCAALLRKKWPDIRFSSVYRTAPREISDQEYFLNAVACMETDEQPQDIQEELCAIEKHLKKAPPFRFGPRTIDLDILLIDDRTLGMPELTVPHPRMHERRFVLEPLLELIDKDVRHPLLHETWRELLKKTLDQECERTTLRL